MTDQTAAELITRRLVETLSDAEQTALDKHLAHSLPSKQLADLVEQIQTSVVEHRDQDTASDTGPGLDAVTKERLTRRLLDELNSGQGTRKVAEDQGDYRHDE